MSIIVKPTPSGKAIRQTVLEKGKKYKFKRFYDKMEGLEFEQFCGELLRRNGYDNVSVTQGSGDQGIDILAEKNGIKIAVQCKRYSGNVGNDAVQEACTGKLYYDCHVASVLTNSYFTASAKALAEKTGILLWNRDVLEELISTAGFGPIQEMTKNSQGNDSLLAEAIKIAKETGYLSIFTLQRRLNLDYDTAIHLIDEIDSLGIIEINENVVSDDEQLKLDDESERLLCDAIDVVLELGEASVSILQREFKLGYSNASGLIDKMERLGIVGPYNGSTSRDILMSKERWESIKNEEAPCNKEYQSFPGQKSSHIHTENFLEKKAHITPVSIITDLTSSTPTDKVNKTNGENTDTLGNQEQLKCKKMSTDRIMDRKTALILCLFLGWAGAHRFYVRKYFTGILWLVTLGLFFVGWFVDSIMILAKAFKTKDGLYLI